jgi:hypothetical protein
MKHTPGPWTHALNASGSMRGVRGRRDGPNGPSGMVCYMTNPVQGNLEGSADAYLIGAAPDLLEALEALLIEKSEEWFADADPTGNWHRAKQARAKAKGEVA